MRAVGYQNSLPIEDPNALVDIDLPKPEAKGRDLLVEVRAVSAPCNDSRIIGPRSFGKAYFAFASAFWLSKSSRAASKAPT